MQMSGALIIPFIRIYDIDPIFASGVWSVISFGVGLAVIIYLLREDMKQVDMRSSSEIGTIALWALLGMLLAYSAQIASILIETYILHIEPGSQNTSNIMDIARTAPIFIIVVTVFAPVLEELIFRKIIFGSIYKRTNFIIAALASALIFGLVHNDNPHILIYTSMGMVFAFLYVQTKRIIVPIIAHMGINTFAVVMQYSVDPAELERRLEQFEQQIQMIFLGG